MNGNIEETRKIRISGKVISPDNIRSLADVLHESYEEGIRDEKGVRLNFRIGSPEGSDYESDSIELFKEDGWLHQKWISYFEMTYSDYSSDDSRIHIQISHGDRGYPYDQIIVSGKNSVWVNGQFQRFENIIENWKPQVSWPRKYETLFEFIIGIGFGRAYFFILDIIFGYVFSFIQLPKIESPPTWLLSVGPILEILLWFFSYSIGIWPAMRVTSYFKKLWPSIEIQTGPDHAQLIKTKRKKLGLVVTFVLIPVLVNLLIDLIKLI